MLRLLLRMSSQPKEGDAKKTKRETPKEPAWGRNRGNSAVTSQALGRKCKELGWLLGTSKGETNTSCVDNESTICASVQAVHLSAHDSLAIVKTEKELDLNADTCVVGDHSLVVHYHNRPMNIFGSKIEACSHS